MNKKELKKQYVQTVQPMGVLQIKNLINGKIFIESGTNINGRINRCKFQLSNGSHRNKSLQEDYNNGAEHFEYEILDYLKPKENTRKGDYAKELKLLEEMWLDKLQPYYEKGYNKRPEQ